MEKWKCYNLHIKNSLKIQVKDQKIEKTIDNANNRNLSPPIHLSPWHLVSGMP